MIPLKLELSYSSVFLNLPIKQLAFFESWIIASKTEEIFLTEHSENFELLGRSPLVADANMI